ncbi:hypothetical protein [Lysobacter antibioticus]|uniref:hypothetical protein n=1 Tax=Lysobacter antibioticus TaxID=84531 RepID=UPI0011408A55|nr:hypothetical protein [Lysobacter antibioticus]
MKRFEELGCSVVELHHAGIPGFPDLVVGCLGVNHLVEVKNPDTAYGRAGLNANQQTFNRDWRGERMFAVSSLDEAAALVQNWRRAAKSRTAA